MSRIVSFGDSWTYGYELDNPEKECYTNKLSEKVNVDFENFGASGNSFSFICSQIFSFNFSKDDFILVCIPPDIRFFGENANGEFFPLFCTQDKNPEEDIQKQFNYFNEVIVNFKNWHPYFQLLNLFSIQEYFAKIKANFLFFTNYGNIDYSYKFNGKIDKSNFLIKHSLTKFLGGEDSDLVPSRLNTDLVEVKYFRGKYFKGNYSHPNAKGHEKIADLIYNNSKFQEWLM